MSAAVTILQHRHPCPTCGKTWTHRIAPNVCRAYNGEPLRCGLCQVDEQAPAPPDRRWERIAWALGFLAVIGQSIVLAWALS
mgnify:CR=1 FL=1